MRRTARPSAPPLTRFGLARGAAGALCASLGLMLASVGASLLLMPAHVAHAADDAGGSYLNPFPDGDVYPLAIVGDTFADGLQAGLLEGFVGDTRLTFEKKTRVLPGIMSGDFEARVKDLAEQFTREPAQIIVVMVGEDDRVPLKSSSGRRVAIMSEEWRTEYGRRVDRMMKALKRENVGVYWVGLPSLARADANEQARAMNDVVRERALLNGLRFVDIYAGFTDDLGAYAAYGPDLGGKIRIMRRGDGVHFTESGNRKLSHFVEKQLRRDLNRAKSERSVPLLGAEPEQAKINPDNAVKTPAPSSPAATIATTDAAAPAAPVVGAATVDPSADQKADNSKVSLRVVGAGGREEVQAVEILRPAIPASVVQLMARRESSGQGGDLLVEQIAGGMTLMTSITNASPKAASRQAPSQAPYFRFLVKGERLSPKPGRADDSAWPRTENSSDVRKAPVQPKS
ncbi:MAG: SGNH/GDSL hydrolase family protein [Hyphomicrobium sp.]